MTKYISFMGRGCTILTYAQSPSLDQQDMIMFASLINSSDSQDGKQSLKKILFTPDWRREIAKTALLVIQASTSNLPSETWQGLDRMKTNLMTIPKSKHASGNGAWDSIFLKVSMPDDGFFLERILFAMLLTKTRIQFSRMCLQTWIMLSTTKTIFFLRKSFAFCLDEQGPQELQRSEERNTLGNSIFPSFEVLLRIPRWGFSLCITLVNI